MKTARIIDGWVCCPVCGKRQFPAGRALIHNLEWQCKFSRCKEHFVVETVEKNAVLCYNYLN